MGKFKKWFMPEAERHTEIAIEAYSFNDASHTMLSFGYDRNNSELYFSIGVSKLFGLYLRYQGKYAPQYRGRIDENKEFSLRIFDWALWITLWEDPDTWTKGDRHWTIRPIDILLGRVDVAIDTYPNGIRSTISMLEGDYDVVVTSKQYTRTRARLPFWRQVKKVWNVECVEGIPFPGKCENGWDCGDDALCEAGYYVDTPYEAVDKFKQSVMEYRRKYGHESWTPDNDQAS